jgi:hypothetical protein
LCSATEETNLYLLKQPDVVLFLGRLYSEIQLLRTSSDMELLRVQFTLTLPSGPIFGCHFPKNGLLLDCHKHDDNYTLTLSKEERHKALSTQDNRKVRIFCEFYHQAGQGRKKWRSNRRMIGVIDHTDRGDQQLFLVTNIKGNPPNYLYEHNYCRRGKAENFIHELKSLHATRLSCEQFWANQFRLLEHALAYLLLFKLRELLPPACQKMSVGSVRDNIVKVAVVVRDLTKKIILQWTRHYFWRKQFLHVASRLQQLPLRC